MALPRRANHDNSQPLPPGEPSQTARARRDERMRGAGVGPEPAMPDRDPVSPAAASAEAATPPDMEMLSASLANAKRAADLIRARAEADAQRIRVRAEAEAERIRAAAEASAPEPARAQAPAAPRPDLAEAVEEAQHAAALLQGVLSRLADRLTASPPR